MTAALAIARRECAAMFRTPAGWIVMALYAALTGLIFALTTLAPGEPATLRYFFGPAAWLLIVVCPAISMRLFSEERRAGSETLLFASPAGELAIASGKLAGAAAYLVAMIAPTVAFPITLAVLAEPTPELGPVLSGYLGLLLAGLACLSIGALVSTMTDNQTLSFLATLIVLLLALVATGLVADRLPPSIGTPLARLSPAARVGMFSKGVIDTGAVGYFLAAAIAGLLASAASLRARRLA